MFDNFFFEKSPFGDIIAVYNQNGTKLAAYTYDAWGNQTLTTILGNTAIESVIVRGLNPLRYRGYYYDSETGLYYLNSRYYNPEVGRFVNADEVTNLGVGRSIQCLNLCYYAENNPVCMMDKDGQAAINVICAAIGAVVGWFFCDWVAKKLGYYNGWKYWAIRAGIVVGGAVIGWFAGTLIANIIATYLRSNPGTVFRISSKLGAKGFKTAM